MHPSGVQFGLSRGLLQLRGEEVLLSDQLVGAISLDDPEFWDEFSNGAVDVKIKPGKSIAKLQKSLFKVCHDVVKKRYAENDPDNARHADLIA